MPDDRRFFSPASMTASLRAALVESGQPAIDDPVLLRVAGVTKFAGRPVISRGQLAVEIRGRADD